jgi:hypothetical protein
MNQNNLMWLFIWKFLNNESIKLDNSHNMMTHLEVMKDLIVFCLKTFSSYKHTKNKLSPFVISMIKNVIKKYEHRRTKSIKRKKSKGGSNSPKKSASPSKKSASIWDALDEDYKMPHLKRSGSKKSATPRANNVSPHISDERGTVFGPVLNIEKRLSQKSLTKMDTIFEKMKGCKNCLDIDFLFGLIDENETFVCDGFTGEQFIQECFDKIIEESKKNINNCNKNCKIKTKDGKKIPYKYYIQQTLNHKLIFADISEDIEQYLIGNIIPKYIAKINSQFKDLTAVIQHTHGEETLRLKKAIPDNDKYLRQIKSLRERQQEKIKSETEGFISNTMVRGSKKWPEKKQKIVDSSVVAYKKILNSIFNIKKDEFIFRILPMICAIFTIIYPEIPLVGYVKLVYYLIIGCYTFALIIKNLTSNVWIKTLLEIMRIIFLLLPFLPMLLNWTNSNKDMNPSKFFQQGGAWWDTATNAVTTASGWMTDKALELWLFTIKTFLKSIYTKMGEPIIENIYEHLDIILVIICILYSVLEAWPKLFDKKQEKKDLEFEVTRDVTNEYYSRTNWIELLEDVINGNSRGGMEVDELAERMLEFSQRATDNAYKQQDLDAQLKQAEAQESTAAAQLKQAEAQLKQAEAQQATAAAQQDTAASIRKQTSVQKTAADAQQAIADATREQMNQQQAVADLTHERTEILQQMEDPALYEAIRAQAVPGSTMSTTHWLPDTPSTNPNISMEERLRRLQRLNTNQSSRIRVRPIAEGLGGPQGKKTKKGKKNKNKGSVRGKKKK